MKAMKCVLSAAMLTAMCASSAPSFAAGPAYTSIGTVKLIEAGWSVDAMSVYHSNTVMTNPAGCTVTDAGYATLNTDPGRALFHTLLLSAMLNGKQVKLLISGTACAFNKPRIIAVQLMP